MSPTGKTRRRLLQTSVALTTALSGCIGSVDRIPGVGGSEMDAIVDDEGDSVTLERVDTDTASEEQVVDTSRELTLLYFFATWCEPCAPQNEELAEVEADIDASVTAMRAISPESDATLVGEYWTDSPSDFPALLDPDATVMEYYSVNSYPSIVLVDSTGSVLWEPGDERQNLSIGTVPADVVLDMIGRHRQ